MKIWFYFKWVLVNKKILDCCWCVLIILNKKKIEMERGDNFDILYICDFDIWYICDFDYSLCKFYLLEK